ncbi:hypothetical protein EWM64_g9467 [Hericium alpestre]|uniref:ATP-dependent RNA helicase n=1 Tax=Hericium alpestre TaxID=135208 RepID=A0A4Y9ZIG2_9AGAM|nr:hypothetical protein EWM64_g9467 [Hericium alpestre]
MTGKDLLLKGRTGSGKSFGLVLALLSKYRPPTGGSKPATSSLLIIPHRDLAYQFLHWIERIVKATDPTRSLPSMVQILVRGANKPAAAQAATLKESPPNILIATPQALFDVLEADEQAFDLQNLSTVVVDECDYLLDYVPTVATKVAKLKAELRMKKHPSLTQRLLDIIYTGRTGSTAADAHPQLVLCSATFRNGLRQHVYASGWVRKGQVVGGREVQHSALVVSETGEIKNIEGAVERHASPEVTEGYSVVEKAMSAPLSTSLPDLPDELTARFADTGSPFHEPSLEAIAAAFAVDVPRIAMLVLPASAPVQRAVYDLRLLGVNAFGLDLLADDRGRRHLLRGSGDAVEENPTLLVTTLATTRGLDLPDLSHVFILGVADARKVDTYLHLAGRVGRFGRRGKVVSVLEERHSVTGQDGKTAWKDEPAEYLRLLRTLGITPIKHDYFF